MRDDVRGQGNFAPERLLIFGASTRAAAFSARRAGLDPWCADLFADVDLAAVCPVVRVTERYPAGFAELIETDVAGPWMYTGGLENHPSLVSRMARRRMLLGNDADVLRRVRDPNVLSRAARDAELRAPELAREPKDGRWLVKPIGGTGGSGIRVWNDGELVPKRGVYWQEYLEGPSASAVYVAIDGAARLFGLTRQLIGESYLHAPPFRYAGSVGPLAVETGLREKIERLGTLLTERTGLRGLFGIDGILHDGSFAPVEVNPRYTASIEVLERATGLRAIEQHLVAFGYRTPKQQGADALRSPGDVAASFPTCRLNLDKLENLSPPSGAYAPRSPSEIVGKGILYARTEVLIPDLSSIPDLADLPHPGDRIEIGRPILTLFASASNETSCITRLRERAAAIEARLYAGG